MHAYGIGMRILPKPNAIWKACQALDISRDEFARQVGVSRETAYRIDSGTVDPSPKFIAGMISVTGRPFEELFDIVAAQDVA